MDEVFNLAELTLIVDSKALEIPIVGGVVTVSAVGERYDWSARIHLARHEASAFAGRVQIEAVTGEGHILRGAADVTTPEDSDMRTMLLLLGVGPLKIVRSS